MIILIDDKIKFSLAPIWELNPIIRATWKVLQASTINSEHNNQGTSFDLSICKFCFNSG